MMQPQKISCKNSMSRVNFQKIGLGRHFLGGHIQIPILSYFRLKPLEQGLHSPHDWMLDLNSIAV
jgi:hypothetical protein